MYGYGGGYPFGWHSLLVFLLVISTIFVFIGFDCKNKDCERE